MQIHKIAVIEDDAPIRNMYKLKLENNGFLVSTAEDGKQGLEIIKQFKPGLLLLDLKMPVMSGDEMLREVRKHSWGSNIRVIVLTNISRDEAPTDLQFLSIDRYIVKAHYTPGQVLEIVNDVLGLKNSLKTAKI